MMWALFRKIEIFMKSFYIFTLGVQLICSQKHQAATLRFNVQLLITPVLDGFFWVLLLSTCLCSISPLDATLNISIVRKSGAPRFEPGAAG